MLYLVLSLLAVVVIYIILDRLIRIPMLPADSRYVFITGCDTGFGYDLSKRLDHKGCHVIAACLTDKGETELRKECSGRLKTVCLNVASHESVVKAFDAVKSMLPAGRGLWGIVNNAGIMGKGGLVEWLTLDDYRQALSVNLLGVIDVTTTFLPLVKKEKGRIINMSSLSGRISLAGNPIYTIAKYGVEAFSDGLRRQLREAGISVHILEPGMHKTSLSAEETIVKALETLWEENHQHMHFSKEAYDNFKREALADFLQIPKRDPHYVVDAYEHALFARFPRPRYLIGPDAFLLANIIARLPEWMSDSLIAWAFPLKAAKIPVKT